MNTLSSAQWTTLLADAGNGNADACFELGYCHEYGVQDEHGLTLTAVATEQALYWYTQAAGQGHASAQCTLSTLLSTGEGIVRNVESAKQWARKAIRQGNATAAFNLATIYRDQQRPAQAFRCYQQAARMGDSDAMLQLGLCCLFGLGTAQDAAAARDWLQRLLQADPATQFQRSREDALYWLAIVQLLNRGGSRKSLSEARHLLERANADDDHEQANELLNLIGKSRYLHP